MRSKILYVTIAMLLLGITVKSCLTVTSRASTNVTLSLIPVPKQIHGKINKNNEYKALEYKATISCFEENWNQAENAFCEYSEKIHGINFTKSNDAEVQLIKDQGISKGAYKIESGKKVIIYASDENGLNYALAMLLQMLQKSDNGIYIPTVKISDYADSSYRGMMVDLARNWHDLKYLLNYVDMCYYYKINVLHLHFTDSQSYTLPCDTYPDLPTENRHYTKDQISTLVEYSHARGVELMPEIDVPGHCESFQKKYHDIFGLGGIIHQHENSFEALEGIFNELCDMFPYSKYIHIGGDEATISKWLSCAKCKKYAEDHGIDTSIKDTDLLQEQMYAHFVTRLANVVFENGRTPIVWEGFSSKVNDLVSKDIIVMSWENYYQPTPQLIEAGYKIINCSWVPLYIVTPDVHWSQKEVFNWNIYSWKPVHGGSPYPNGLKIEPTDQVLGGQILAWGDKIMTEYKNVDDGVKEEMRLLLERLPALSENTWNVKNTRDYDEFKKAFSKTNGDLTKVLKTR